MVIIQKHRNRGRYIVESDDDPRQFVVPAVIVHRMTGVDPATMTFPYHHEE